ncbi:uncharacterized protein LOC114362496 [Ostrinia furnacalis]|uniref:uncharacterized protein LOC114362496 n=1 Tax=Ostrinia furnacalis TaxID=93504 RepID=UPI00103E61DE|nr:uncharacterized protein LOC114362496 [Ostrinia furnacalis]
MNLSFAGCGFLGIYHVGVAVCFKKYAPHLLLGKISGASFGALSACCLLCDLPIGELTSDVLRVVGEARAGSLGPFSPSFNIQNVLLEGMEKYLPHDVHKIVSGKLHISLTRVYDGQNVIVSEFPTREDLMQALLASCFVPVFSGLLPPRFHGIRYMDGGFSDNLPVLDENTITVSPFCGESDICPRDLSSQLFHVNLANTSIELSKQNINRFARILFPPKPETLSNMCKQGFDDALRFLQRNNMISCTRCLAVQSTFQLQDVLDDTTNEFDPDCEECKTHRQDALVDDLPDTVMTIFQNAIDTANSGIVNWVMRQRAMRYLSVMALPYRVPIDVMYATFTKFVSCTPKMSKSLWKLSWNVLQQLHGFVYSAHDRSEAAAKIYYKLTMDSKKEGSDGYQLDRRRASEFRISYSDVRYDEGDTFEHILSVTSHNEALLAYYYLDSDNKMKMTEIYDVTDADTEAVQSPMERDLNHQLEFDNDWSADLIADSDELDIQGLDDDDDLADRNIFSDPESEWAGRRTHSNTSESDGEQPESDQYSVGRSNLLEHIDCERLAKTVNKRAVILTNFMLTNLLEATSQLLSNTTLLTSLLLEGLPLKIPYLNPLCEALLANNSLQHLYLPRCLIGDAGCLAVCKAVRCLPNVLTLDLSGCELTPLGAGYIADLIKYQKIHRYSENWIHTLRYRMPELDTMAGLRRITLCGNTQLNDLGAAKLFEVLADDLWIKAVDVQNCGLTEQSAATALHMMQSNTTMVILDIRHNADICMESLSKLRAALRENERGAGGQYSWLGNVSGCSIDGRSVKSVASKNGVIKDRIPTIGKNIPAKFVTKANVVKKEKEYAEVLEEQLQEEISHRQQLEELNLQLVDQMKQLKQQQIRLWANGATSSGSEQSFQASSRSGDLSSSSGSTSSVPIDQNTLSYIQQAFKDIYAFIKNNQCHGQCLHETSKEKALDEHPVEEVIAEITEIEEFETNELRINIVPKKAQSSHQKLTENANKNKMTKSAHLLGDAQRAERQRDSVEMKPEMFERHMGDTKNSHGEESTTEEMIAAQVKLKKGKNSNEHNNITNGSIYASNKGSSCSSVVSDSSDTLVSPRTQRAAPAPAPNPREALYSSTDEDSD